MDKFVVNIIHRPELAPEYAEKVTGSGKKENIGRQDLLDESLQIFEFQQETAHKNGLKTTIQITYASLFSQTVIDLAKKHHEEYGDEIALSLLGLPCKQFREKYQTKDFCIWMFSLEDKKSIVDDVFGKFYEAFGFYPESTGSYYMDAELINYIKKAYPTVKCAVATCWEEGPKAYHTCNNSWYTFMDGGPWAPWIPSKQNTHAPAADEQEDSGIVAIPHLSRDLLACYDGNGSNFGTHPQNVLRGMIYDTKTWEFPYLYNLIDQYRDLEKYNHGYAYNMMFVGPGWLNKMGRWEQPYELLKKSYEEGMAYYGQLKKEGKLTDMTMAEFADYYRAKKTYTEPECALWRDILYGSDKQLFWYCDPFMRACINMDQGGALVDLRNYAAKLKWPVGIGTKHITDASYPFLIQEKYRAGYFTHYAGEGTVRSCKFSYQGEEADLCQCRTHAHFSEQTELVDGKEVLTRILTLDPVEIEFSELRFKVQSIISFTEGSSRIAMTRKIYDMSDPSAKIGIKEYMVACYGTTEYSEDMSHVTLGLEKDHEQKLIAYQYKNREEALEGATSAWAIIPEIETKVSMSTDRACATGHIVEGYAFSPMFTLSYTEEIGDQEEMTTWLKLEKEN
ncbi:MAG: hypothetical protein K6G23_06315 [Lachnospiraceae bacterium]|nr:hypothetical protein [Lachnospiraceae bacterium]